jgi:hypothetical protein
MFYRGSLSLISVNFFKMPIQIEKKNGEKLTRKMESFSENRDVTSNSIKQGQVFTK